MLVLRLIMTHCIYRDQPRLDLLALCRNQSECYVAKKKEDTSLISCKDTLSGVKDQDRIRSKTSGGGSDSVPCSRPLTQPGCLPTTKALF